MFQNPKFVGKNCTGAKTLWFVIEVDAVTCFVHQKKCEPEKNWVNFDPEKTRHIAGNISVYKFFSIREAHCPMSLQGKSTSALHVLCHISLPCPVTSCYIVLRPISTTDSQMKLWSCALWDHLDPVFSLVRCLVKHPLLGKASLF